MKKLICVLVVVFMVLLSGCSTVPAEGSTTTVDTSPSSNVTNSSSTYDGVKVYSDSEFTVVRFTDFEKGVTCWLMDGYQSGGIFCMDK